MEDMTWPDIDEIIQSGNGMAVIPVGSTEQHGHHLPLATDTLNVAALARLAAAEVEGVFVTPAIPFGVAGNHMNFAGTLNVRHRTLMSLLNDIVASLAAHGVRKVILANGHGGNIGAVKAAAEEIREQFPDLRLGVLYTAVLTGEESRRVLESAIEWHAEEAETSMLLATHPGLVRQERAQDWIPTTAWPGLESFTEEALTHTKVDYGLPKTEVLSTVGTIGEPSLASSEKGEVMIRESVAAFVEVLQQLQSG